MLSNFLSGLVNKVRSRPSRPPPRERQYYGLEGLDRKLEPYIDFDNGTFVEAGANDGLTQSNTAYFDEFRGWHGLLIEPIPELAEKCRVNRPRCFVENCALLPAGADASAVSMTYCNLMSVVDGGWADSNAERTHVESGRALQQLETYRVDVAGWSLSSLLDRHRMPHVDLLSLDVEGYERKALAGIDFGRHRPNFILVEARFREDIDQILLPRYDAIAQLSHHDILYRLRNA